MQRDVVWRAESGSGSEYLRLHTRRGIQAASTLTGSSDGQAFEASYAIGCDAFWRTRRVRVHLTSAQRADIILRSDGNGHWKDGCRELLPALDGCRDVDISATPFTNTLPIKRLALRPGESADLVVVFVDIPTMTVQPVRQRYTCLDRHASGALYRFESMPYDALPDGFMADLQVDADGLVLDYPGSFNRIDQPDSAMIMSQSQEHV